MPNDSLWTRYKACLNPKQDLHDIFFRSHDRHAVLDGARAITILGMVLFHVVYGVVRLLGDHVDRFIATYPDSLDWTWQIQGSDPLFVMCGLLVSYSLFREYDKTGGIRIGQFYKNRLMRIMPLFLFALLFYLPTDSENYRFLLSNFLFINNFIPGQDQIIPVGWSLNVQMHFYFILPGIVLLMFQMRRPVLVLALLMCGSTLIRYLVITGDPVSYEFPFYNILYDTEFAHLLSDKLYYDLEDRVGSFIIGVLVAYLHLYHGQAITAFLTRHWFFCVLLFLSAVLMVAIPLFIPVHDRQSFFYEDFSVVSSFWYLVVNRYVYSAGIGLVVLLALCPAGPGRWIEKLFALPVWHPFAQLIFPIYLFHFPFILVGAVLTFWTTNPEDITHVSAWQVFVMYGWAVFFTVLFSIVLHLFLEKPFLTMRNAKP